MPYTPETYCARLAAREGVDVERVRGERERESTTSGPWDVARPPERPPPSGGGQACKERDKKTEKRERERERGREREGGRKGGREGGGGGEGEGREGEREREREREMYVYIYMFMYICIYIYVCMYTYIEYRHPKTYSVDQPHVALPSASRPAEFGVPTIVDSLPHGD